jgi:hypothetical protein
LCTVKDKKDALKWLKRLFKRISKYKVDWDIGADGFEEFK